MNNSKFVFILLFLLKSAPSFSGERVRIVFSERVNSSAYFYVKAVEKIYRKIGLDPIIRVSPESRAMHLFETQKVDAIGAKLEEFESRNLNSIKINVPIIENFKFKAFVLKKDLDRVKKIDTPFVVTGHGCLGCQIYADLFKMNVSSYDISLVKSLNLLDLKRADIVIAPAYIIENLPGHKYIQIDENVFKSSYYHFISKKKSHLKEKLEKEFLKAKTKGAFDMKKVIKIKNVN